MRTKLVASLVGVIVTILAIAAWVGHFLPDASDSAFGLVLLALALVGVNLLLLVALYALVALAAEGQTISRPEDCPRDWGVVALWSYVFLSLLITLFALAFFFQEFYTSGFKFVFPFLIVVAISPLFIVGVVEDYKEEKEAKGEGNTVSAT